MLIAMIFLYYKAGKTFNMVEIMQNAKGITMTAQALLWFALYVAFFPLFLDSHLPLPPQLLVYGGTFLFLASANATLYALLAGEASRFLTSHRARRWLNRLSGGLLILCAGLLGFARRA